MERKEIDRMHIINFFKLLSLIIIASELRVLTLLFRERTAFEEINVIPQIPLICEYLFVSLVILCIGFLVWYIIDRRISNIE